MATRSRKFDIFTAVKAVCFILALIFAVTGALKTADILLYMEKNDGYDAVWNGLIMQKEEYYCFESEQFNENLSEFALNAMKISGLYSSPTQKEYENFKKTVNNIYINNLINVLLSENLENDPYFTFFCLNHGYISLKKLADTSAWSNGFFLYDTNDTAFSAYVSGDDDGYIERTTPDAPTQPATTMLYEVYDNKPSSTVPQYYISTEICEYEDFWNELNIVYSDSFEVKNGIIYVGSMSNYLIEKAAGEKADLILSLSPVYFGEKKTLYSGVYAVTINREKLDLKNPEKFIALGMSFPQSFGEYKNECYNAQNSLKKYKNAYFFSHNNKSGNIITNISDAEITSLSKAEAYINKKCNSDYAVYDYDENSFTDYLTSGGNLFWVFNSNRQLFAGKDNYFCVGIDKTLSGGEDPFTLIALDTAEIISTVKNALPALLICLFGFLMSIIVLMILSGRKCGDDGLYLMALDVIPTDLRIIINAGICVLPVYFLGALSLYGSSEVIVQNGKTYSFIFGMRLLIAACAALVFSAFIDLLMYIARRAKDRSFFRNISLVILIRFAVKKIQALKKKLTERPAVYVNIHKSILKRVCLFFLLPNVIALAATIIFDEIILIPILILIYDLIFIFRSVRYTSGVNMIFDSLHQLRMGNSKTYLDPDRFPRLLKSNAEDLDKVSDGLSIAVENAVREQKTKTELITNVSHDLKTPLTSIVSYVDLLKRCDINNSEAEKYISVLGEKSERLKKLIEDLVEASKASTGNVNVCLVKMSLNELILQILGEYDDDFEKKGLTPVLEIPDENVTVEADSKLSYRILDNLFGNVKKYSMPGTRVYISLLKNEKTALVTIRNISEQQLNVPASALMERFVRGDESRSTEGSGLGLSIAESFSKLQKGSLNIEINGDMFTAEVEFKLI